MMTVQSPLFRCFFGGTIEINFTHKLRGFPSVTGCCKQPSREKLLDVFILSGICFTTHLCYVSRESVMTTRFFKYCGYVSHRTATHGKQSECSVCARAGSLWSEARGRAFCYVIRRRNLEETSRKGNCFQVLHSCSELCELHCGALVASLSQR